MKQFLRSPGPGFLSLLLLSAGATARGDDVAAVSGLNGKVDYAGGRMNGATGNNVEGSLSAPIFQEIGVQADALYSHIGSSDFYGGAGHAFWRDPNLGLLGLTGGGLGRTGVSTFQVGVEGEFYLDRFTFGAFFGLGGIDYGQRAPFISSDPKEWVGSVSVGFYPLDDLLLQGVATRAFRGDLLTASAEYQTPWNGLSLTAEAAAGDYGYHHWLLGLRYYFGPKEKSLRDRHRQDDPPSLMRGLLTDLGLYGANYNRSGNAYLQLHHEAGTYGNYGTYGETTFTSVPPVGVVSHP